MIRILVSAGSLIVMILSAQFSFADVSWTQQQRPVIHKVTGDETLWFIAQVYYKKGENYKKIMTANGLKTPESVKQGAMLVIPNPLFSNHDQNFQARYDLIHKIREDKFSAMASSSQKAQKRVLASDHPSNQNNEKTSDSETSSVRRFVAE